MRLRLKVRRSKTDRDSCFVATEQRGPLVGRVRFAGEDDYIRVDERRLRGYRFKLHVRRRCLASSGREPTSHNRPDVPTLAACSENGGELYAESRKGHASVFGYAPSTRHGAMPSFSYVIERASSDAFEVAEDLSTAVLSPPMPFSGTATYSAADGALDGRLSWRSLNGKRIVVTPALAQLEVTDEPQCFGGPLSGRARGVPGSPLFGEAADGLPDWLSPRGSAPGLPPLG